MDQDGFPEAPSADAFARLAIELHDSDGVEETVQGVVDFALQALTCTHAGVALVIKGRRLEVPAVTEPTVAEIYQAQVDQGDGPLLECLRTRAPVVIADTKEDERWLDWSLRVQSLSVRSVLDVPLSTAVGVIGVLGLYSSLPDAFTEDDQAIAHILARHASVAVANAKHDESMLQAVDARKLVGQAMGILMERYDLDGDRAFEVLKRYSQDNNQKLRDVAEYLIETRNLPGAR